MMAEIDPERLQLLQWIEKVTSEHTAHVEREQKNEARLAQAEMTIERHDKELDRHNDMLDKVVSNLNRIADGQEENTQILSEMLTIWKPTQGLIWFLSGIGKALKSPAAWGATVILAFLYSVFTGDFAAILDKI